jgi:hypothetical protein
MLTQHTGAGPTILIIRPSWSESSPHWSVKPSYVRHLLAGNLGPIRALEVEIGLAVRGSPVYNLNQTGGFKSPLRDDCQEVEALYDGFN